MTQHAHFSILDERHRALLDFTLDHDGDYVIGRSADAAEIVLPGAGISRRHCTLRLEGARVLLRDEGSTNGTRLGNRAVGSDWVPLVPGDVVSLGTFSMFHTLAAGRIAAPAATASDGPTVTTAFPAPWFDDSMVEIVDLRAAGFGIDEVDVVSIGGGAASFMLVDELRVRGVAAGRVRVVAPQANPLAVQQRWFEGMGLSAASRIRAHPAFPIDNLWGVPSYAMTEARRALGRGRPGAAAASLLRAGVGSSLADPAGVRLDVLFARLDREMRRIGWEQMRFDGQALAIRRLSDGRFAVACRRSAEAAEGLARNLFLVAPYVHLATGAPTPSPSPVLADFRKRNRGSRRVLTIGDGLAPIHDRLAADGGHVAILGGGPLTGLILARLLARRGHSGKSSVSLIGPDLRFQDDVWPLHAVIGAGARLHERATAQARTGLAKAWTEPSLPETGAVWRQVVIGEAEGWFRTVIGEVTALSKSEDRIAIDLRATPEAAPERILADFVIDTTSTAGDPLGGALHQDLVATYGLARQGTDGGYVLDGSMAVAALSQPGGSLHVSGAPAAGGAMAGADSLIGCRLAARRIARHIARRLTGRGFGPHRSAAQWLRWMRGVEP